MNDLEQAMAALLALAGPSFRVARTAHNTAQIDVFSVKSQRGRVLMPFVYNLEVEISVHLDEAHRTYSFSGRSFETSGFSMSVESFRGIYLRSERALHFTLDGVVPVAFDTGIIFQQIESTLVPMEWRRD